jgi:hypothetical protein
MMMLHHIFLRFGNSECVSGTVEQGGWRAWPVPFTDLNPIDFYLGGHLWSTVYSAEVCDMWDLQQ